MILQREAKKIVWKERLAAVTAIEDERLTRRGEKRTSEQSLHFARTGFCIRERIISDCKLRGP
jgi:hypothetical protein